MVKASVGNLNFKNRFLNKLFISASLIFIIFGAYHIHSVWKQNLDRERGYAYTLAESIAALISPDQISSMVGNKYIDTKDDNYLFLSRSLSKIEGAVPQVSSAYVLVLKDGKPIYLVDPSNKEGDVSTFQSSYEYKMPEIVMPYFRGEESPPEGSVHKHGDLTSVYMPLRKGAGGEIIAVIGVDYFTKALLEEAVKGMLPKNRLGKEMLTKLRIFKGPKHTYTSIKPLELK